MIRRLLSWFVGLPAVVVLLLLALANRHTVMVSLDPLSPDQPWLGFELPLWVVFYAGILLGVIAGGMAAWMRQARWRKRARQLKRELALERTARKRLERELMGGGDRKQTATIVHGGEMRTPAPSVLPRPAGLPAAAAAKSTAAS